MRSTISWRCPFRTTIAAKAMRSHSCLLLTVSPAQKLLVAAERFDAALAIHTSGRLCGGEQASEFGSLGDVVAAFEAEERLDGKYLLSTSDPDLSAEDVALGYKNLLEAERGFRDLKSTIELGPVFHRLEHRIRAHILLSWLALLLIRIAERQTKQTWRSIALELQRLHLVTLTGPTGTLQQTTRPPTRSARS